MLSEFHSICRVARKHFSAVEPYKSDGLTLALAGVKDMNVLFSNFAFVVSVRGLCQVMEAAQADPDLVFKLQVSPTTGLLLLKFLPLDGLRITVA